MLKKIISRIPSHLYTNKLIFRNSNESNQDNKEDVKPKKPLNSSLFQKQIVSHLMKLQAQIKNKKQLQKELFGTPPKSTKPKFRYNVLTSLFNRSQQKIKESTQQTTNQKNKEQQQKENQPTEQEKTSKSRRQILFAAVMFGFWVWWMKNSVKVEISDGQISRLGKSVSEAQMITLLSSGAMTSEVLIVRQRVKLYNIQGTEDPNRKLYQTICMAKEVGTNSPVVAIVTNLPVFLEKLEAINLSYNLSFVYRAEQLYIPESSIKIGTFITVAIISFIVYRLVKSTKAMRGEMNPFLNENKFAPIKPENIKTYFKDVAGMHEAKQEITEFVDFLKNPDKYIEMGAKIPKGALLTGPPGTGKTLLARACAGQAAVPFFYVSGSEFVEKYVGLGANRVRGLFDAAAKAAPSIIFIDQIDAIGKKRNSGPFANEQKQNTLNQLLVNMDGFDTKNKIIVMAATNLKDSLDPALLRPGRFDRAIEISLPNFEERIQILKVHLTKIKFSQKFTIEQLAKKISVLTPGFSGAELANICNQAAILAARENKSAIELPEFEKATERVMAGLQKRNLFSDDEKECLAYYECGKAVAAWFTQGADPVIKISIAPYSKSGKGYSHEIKDEMPLKTQHELINKAVCCLAGRTAEKHFKGYVTNSGDKDLKRAKRIINFMVAKFGMSTTIGKIGFPDVDYMRKPYSEDMEAKIDKEVRRLYQECHDAAEKLIIERAAMVESLKQLIMEKQTLTHNTLKEILGERPFSDNQNYEKFLKDIKETEGREEEVTVTPPAPQ